MKWARPCSLAVLVSEQKGLDLLALISLALLVTNLTSRGLSSTVALPSEDSWSPTTATVRNDERGRRSTAASSSCGNRGCGYDSPTTNRRRADQTKAVDRRTDSRAGAPAAGDRDRGTAQHSARVCRSVWKVQGENRCAEVLREYLGKGVSVLRFVYFFPIIFTPRTRYWYDPHESRRGKNHDHGGADRRLAAPREKKHRVSAGAESRAGVWDERRGCGGRLVAVPMDEINLHFTGDFHAITSAHNLLSAMVDNHIYWKKQPEIDVRRITWKRVLDMNDRALRKLTVALGGPGNGYPREDGFDITVASEVMAILCLATDFPDLERRLGNIVVGHTRKRDMVTARDLKAHGAMAALLKDAFKPNLVQTLGGSPALIHGGPFANIAHGCNSVQATKLGLELGDIVVTEAGFGADLGAEKFIDIKCRAAGLIPDVVAMVVSCRALKMHGGVGEKELKTENLAAIKTGLANVERHCENLAKFGLPIVISVNKFPTDTDAELSLACETCATFPNVQAALVGDHWAHGGAGIQGVAEAVLKCVEDSGTGTTTTLKTLYPSDLPLAQKIEAIAQNIYRAKGVIFADEARTALKGMQEKGFGHLPVCIAKTQYSFSDDAKKVNAAIDHELHVSEVRLNAGAEFVVAICGAIMTMPGLPETPAAENIGLVDGQVHGLF
ncbi:unnamed protein product [Amoebophrya sp. A120]|nr:unnamed protein product [Amoebophrya sp. A120]|eukprot:GSA120T00000766001.1